MKQDELVYLYFLSTTGVMCGADGKWTKPPFCEELNCDPPPEIENAYVSVEMKPGISEASYTCKKGYKLLGMKKHTCFGNNSWNISR